LEEQRALADGWPCSKPSRMTAAAFRGLASNRQKVGVARQTPATVGALPVTGSRYSRCDALARQRTR
jgi:hypothetical protein